MKPIYPAGAYLLYKPEFAEHKDIQYLTGFKGTTAVFLQTKKGEFLIVDQRYREAVGGQVNKGIKAVVLSASESAFERIDEILKKEKIRRAAIEEYTPIGFVERLKKEMKGIHFVTVSGLVQNLRARKTEKEIGLIESAQKITAKIFNKVLGGIRPGKQTELDLARLIREEAFKFGADDMSFPPIVAFGTNSASPHHASSAQKIGTNGPLLIDFGIKYSGYCSDFTRTTWVGKSPSNEFAAAYETVLRAQEEGIRALRQARGKLAKDIDAAVRKIIDGSPFKGHFIHGTGHGVGLEIHEKPSISAGSKDILRGNEVVTIEPGVYLPKKFGIRIEDVVVNGKNSRVLAKTDKKLLRL